MAGMVNLSVPMCQLKFLVRFYLPSVTTNLMTFFLLVKPKNFSYIYGLNNLIHTLHYKTVKTY